MHTSHYWPAGTLECIEQPALNVPEKLTIVPSTHTFLELQLRRATLHYWPDGAPQRIVQPVLNVTDKITVVPSTHTSAKLQLRRATLHYWQAGAPVCIVQPVLNVPDKAKVVPSTRRPLGSGTGHARARPDLVTVLGVTDYKLLACPPLGNDPVISDPILLYLPEYPCKNWGSRQGVYTHEPILNAPDKITVVLSTHTSLKLQLRRLALLARLRSRMHNTTCSKSH